MCLLVCFMTHHASVKAIHIRIPWDDWRHSILFDSIGFSLSRSLPTHPLSKIKHLHLHDNCIRHGSQPHIHSHIIPIHTHCSPAACYIASSTITRSSHFIFPIHWSTHPIQIQIQIIQSHRIYSTIIFQS